MWAKDVQAVCQLKNMKIQNCKIIIQHVSWERQTNELKLGEILYEHSFFASNCLHNLVATVLCKKISYGLEYDGWVWFTVNTNIEKNAWNN